MEIVQILIPLPLAEPYDYRSGAFQLEVGDFVTVPFGPRLVTGIVWKKIAKSQSNKPLKEVRDKLPLLPMPKDMLDFMERVAAYNMAFLGSVLRMAMSVPDALKEEKAIIAYRANLDIDPSLLTVKRQKVWRALCEKPQQISEDWLRHLGVGRAMITAMIKDKILLSHPIEAKSQPFLPDPNKSGPVLSPDQAKVVERLGHHLKENRVTLLDGVTGSGKTEVYFEAIAACLREGKQVLVLLPEITLTAQWLHRFEARFGGPPGEWHSDLRPKARRQIWRAVLDGSLKIVVGARSALFLPYRNLGLIIVDEEHDHSFKQEEGVIYHARDMAVLRGHLGKIPVILASATPSLESIQNVEWGKYELLKLPSRHGGAQLPETSLIDLRQHRLPSGSFLSQPLIKEVREKLEKKEQILLFLNRRGYAPLTICRSCGERLECPHCAAWLVEHRSKGRLQCHHCGFNAMVPPHCPKCSAENDFAACGPGIERITEEAHRLFPEARLLALSSDLTQSPSRAQEMISRIEKGEIDIIIGTQIIAKGHHFPNLTLVGIIDADLGLTGGDLRGGERCFQLLQQVSGRAGRAEKPGHVIVQTYDPSHPVMQALAKGDRQLFVEAESQDREVSHMPPFGRLAALILSGSNERAVDELARQLARSAPKIEGIRILGPAPAPLAMLRGRYRRRFLIKGEKQKKLQPIISDWLRPVKITGDMAIQIDIDPYSFM